MTDQHGSTGELSPLCAADSDNDALCDNWETTGIDYDADGRPELDLSKFGAEVGKPDLFVEIDWQAGRKPHLAALYKVKEAFQLAPRPINLHTVIDEQVPGDAPIETSDRGFGRYDDVVDLTVGDGPCDGFFGTARGPRGRRTARRAARARKLAFRHAIFGHTHADDAEGEADPGDDAFIVTLGGVSRAHDARRRLRPVRLQRPVRRVRGRDRGVHVHARARAHARAVARRRGAEREPRAELPLDHELRVHDTRAGLNNRPLDYSRKTPVARDEAAFDEALAFYDSYPQRAVEPWTHTLITQYIPGKDVCEYTRVGLTEAPLNLDGDPAPSTVAMGLNDPDDVPDRNGPRRVPEAGEPHVPHRHRRLVAAAASRATGWRGWDEHVYVSATERQGRRGDRDGDRRAGSTPTATASTTTRTSARRSATRASRTATETDSATRACSSSRSATCRWSSSPRRRTCRSARSGRPRSSSATRSPSPRPASWSRSPRPPA